MSEIVDLTATFIPLDGEHGRVRSALDIAIEEVVTEPGCLRYEITADNGSDILLTEQWASEEALATHSKGPAVADLHESLSALLAEPIRLTRP
ncbi:antibiotic biosynthesis monooxygenase [Paenarthrobacter sp. Z7-10]|uniref:putative quinol monooxygenase n=1 Tax=Paenarthrobacter sp. Z7-10 TaxID=2787635 RepID=UPI0022A9874B|nr:putative quinol monooxygenase [Paenarthrobacter sp. Z7-10]MCZ2402160.1 antibiotic biosynthesis monooxygenase [Paenarthrobacter sp. Z7-10]